MPHPLQVVATRLLVEPHRPFRTSRSGILSYRTLRAVARARLVCRPDPRYRLPAVGALRYTAVLGRRPYGTHTRMPEQNFLRSFFMILSFRLFDYPRFEPPRYRRNARSEDMTRIGADMWQVPRKFDEQEAGTQPETGYGHSGQLRFGIPEAPQGTLRQASRKRSRLGHGGGSLQRSASSTFNVRTK